MADVKITLKRASSAAKAQIATAEALGLHKGRRYNHSAR